MYLKTQKCWKFSISKSRKIIFKVHGKLTSGLEMKVGRQENTDSDSWKAWVIYKFMASNMQKPCHSD